MWDNRKLTVLGLRSCLWPSSISLISCHVISLTLIPERSKSIWKPIWGRKVGCVKETKRKTTEIGGRQWGEAAAQWMFKTVRWVRNCACTRTLCQILSWWFFPSKWGAESHFRFLYHSGKHKLRLTKREIWLHSFLFGLPGNDSLRQGCAYMWFSGGMLLRKSLWGKE